MLGRKGFNFNTLEGLRSILNIADEAWLIAERGQMADKDLMLLKVTDIEEIASDIIIRLFGHEAVR